MQNKKKMDFLKPSHGMTPLSYSRWICQWMECSQPQSLDHNSLQELSKGREKKYRSVQLSITLILLLWQAEHDWQSFSKHGNSPHIKKTKRRRFVFQRIGGKISLRMFACRRRYVQEKNSARKSDVSAVYVMQCINVQPRKQSRRHQTSETPIQYRRHESVSYFAPTLNMQWLSLPPRPLIFSSCM